METYRVFLDQRKVAEAFQAVELPVSLLTLWPTANGECQVERKRQGPLFAPGTLASQFQIESTVLTVSRRRTCRPSRHHRVGKRR